MKHTNRLLYIVGPIGLMAAMAKSYTLKITGDNTFHDLGIWEGILIGSITTVVFSGFFILVHFKFFPVPEDLFTGPIYGKGGVLFGGNPAIFRQGLVTGLCLLGTGCGYIISDHIFNVQTVGIGLFLFMPGVGMSILITELWRRLPRKGDRTAEIKKDRQN